MQLTHQPFSEAIRDILDERDMSIRELHRLVRRKTGWGALSTIHFMVKGDIPPSPTGLEAIAKALNIDPEYFAEYRLAKAREMLNPEAVGFTRAMRCYERAFPE